MSELITGLTQELVGGVALGCIYALVALGFTLIFRATEVVNFAQGELMMVGAYANFFLVTWLLGDPGLQALLFGLTMFLFILFQPQGLYGMWLKIRIYWKLFPFNPKKRFG